jgi:iduronate 2-sulfatase
MFGPTHFTKDRPLMSRTTFACLLLLLSPTFLMAETKPNVLLICIDDLRPELGCFGKSYIKSPNIDGLAKAGRAFQRHYVQAPTCGASRFTLLTGMYGSGGNGALFGRSKAVLKRHG